MNLCYVEKYFKSLIRFVNLIIKLAGLVNWLVNLLMTPVSKTRTQLNVTLFINSDYINQNEPISNFKFAKIFHDSFLK